MPNTFWHNRRSRHHFLSVPFNWVVAASFNTLLLPFEVIIKPDNIILTKVFSNLKKSPSSLPVLYAIVQA